MIGTLQIKTGKTGTYFDIVPVKVSPFKTKQIDDNPVVRYEWGELILKNYPKKYKETGEDCDRIYDYINELSPSTEIYVKYTSNTGTEIEGYFGKINCEIDEFRSTIQVIPTIYDQYTYLLEYRDTKVDVFGDDDLVVNGDFDTWSDDVASGWDTLSYKLGSGTEYDIYRDTYFGKNAAMLTSTYVITGGVSQYYFASEMSQVISGIKKGRTAKLSFYYAFIEILNDYSIRKDLSLSIILTSVGGAVKYANDKGEWTDVDEKFIYRSNALALPIGSLSAYKNITLIMDAAPFDGSVEIKFNNIPVYAVYYDTRLAITGVSLYASDITYTEVFVELPSEYVVSKEQTDIEKEGGGTFGDFFIYNPREDDVEDLEDYFDEDNSPSSVIMTAMHGADDLTYESLEAIFNDVDSVFYKAEMCEFTLYKGGDWWSWGKRYRHLKGIARFAREQVYSDAKYTAQDEIDELGVEGEWKPPEEGVGWTKTADKEGYGMLWVRTPFNGAYDEWVLGDVDDENGKIYDFDYGSKITSKRTYPTATGSKSFDTCITLRGVIERVFRGTDPSLLSKNVYSTFLFNDFPDDDKTNALLDAIPLLDSNRNLNYYTLQDNFLDDIAVIHTYDLSTSKNIGDDDSVIEISFSDLMKDLMVIFPLLYWFIDSNGDLHLEHTAYEEKVNDYVSVIGLADGYQKSKYDTAKMYATTLYSQVNSGYKDFYFSKVEFDKIVSNRRAEDISLDIATANISTDIQYCIENPDDLDNGLILVNYETIDGQKITANGYGMRAGKDVVNGKLSLSYMLKNLSTFEGVWENGYINSEATEFKNMKRTRMGTKTINLKGVYEGNYFLTDLGIGFAIKTIDFEKGFTSIDLNYRYSDEFISVSDDEILNI